MRGHLKARRSDSGIHVLELSLTIEFRAYDLYRNLAERTADPRARDSLLTIAQAEKTHMRQLQQAIADLVKATP